MFTSESLELIPDKCWLILGYEKVKNAFLTIKVNYSNFLILPQGMRIARFVILEI